eukprot:CAMPEP_0204201218 /NCGR_PEP_ID=MMETSP0361-20130328/67301_1 /ASSEMBLY_ACC=CAM_ASM_000343 /TAXON_ID=268821 /ORGANISM="Scrippsiella Hangoei, Strain SHTV-5" /LENGTH=41 /DNA_ID= /DNA_START= /DNA_END= /DNA_ORIENTATION=
MPTASSSYDGAPALPPRPDLANAMLGGAAEPLWLEAFRSRV